jgi:hypothetical protein
MLSLVRYYLPFDKKGVLLQFIKSKIESGNIIIIDKVLEECKYSSKGLVLLKFPLLADKEFIKNAKVPHKTDSLIIPNTKLFFHLLEHNFLNPSVKKLKGLSEVEFESQKNEFIGSADMKQVILCLNLQEQGESVVLVTEESEYSNDYKLFKKIPAICKELQIQTMTLPELIEKYEGIDLYFK